MVRFFIWVKNIAWRICVLIVFNEKTQYNNLIKNGFKNKSNVFDLSVLARYYNSQGYSREEIKTKIIDFAKKWEPHFNEYKNENKILKVLDNITKDAIFSPKISFSQIELEKIERLKNIKLQKVIFILMCLAKKDNCTYVYLNTNGIYKLSEIFDLANVDVSKATQEYFLYSLQQSGAIFCNLKPLLKYDMLWCESCSPKILEFEPNENMILEFEKYFGKTIEKKGRKNSNSKTKLVKMELKN